MLAMRKIIQNRTKTFQKNKVFIGRKETLIKIKNKSFLFSALTISGNLLIFIHK